MKKYMTHFLSLALTLVLCFSQYAIFDCFSTGLGRVIGFLTVITATAFQLLCYFTEKHRIVGGILIGLALLLCFRLYSTFTMSAYSLYGLTFNEWLLTRGSEAEGAYYLSLIHI